MLRMIIFAALSLAATAALAQRPSTLTMSCGEATRLVASRGAIVLGTGRFTYDRFVSHAGFCFTGQTVVPAYAPTADTPQCVLGFVCRERDRFRVRD